MSQNQPTPPVIKARDANITQVVKKVKVRDEFGSQYGSATQDINVRELHFGSGEVTEDYLEIIIDGKSASIILINPNFVPQP